MSRLNSFLSNESIFGQIMTRLGILIAVNVLFVVFSIPLITIGASLTALYTVTLRTLRKNGTLNPFTAFLDGFRSNFKQATIAWLIFVALAGFLSLDLWVCRNAAGALFTLRYVFYAALVLLGIGIIYFFPVLAAFDNRSLFLFRTGLYFAFRRPFKMILITLIHVIPLLITILDQSLQPLFVFIWFFIGFAVVAMAVSRLLVNEFAPFLPLVDSEGNFILDDEGKPQKASETESRSVKTGAPVEKTEQEILDEMKKLDI